MRKYFVVAALALVATTASAKGGFGTFGSLVSSDKGDDMSIHLGVRAGLNVSKVTSDMEGATAYGEGDLKSRMGFHVGVIADIPVYRNYLYVTPGLYFTQKGGKYKYEEVDAEAEELCRELGAEEYSRRYGDPSSETYEEKYNPLYLEIPILLSGRYTFGKAQLQVSFGPYIAIGLAGKIKGSVTYGYPYDGSKDVEEYEAKLFKKNNLTWSAYETDASGGKVDEETDDDDEQFPGYKRFDFGFSFGAGVTLCKHYYVGIQYELGLVDMYNSNWKKAAKSDGGKYQATKNKNFMVTVGYNF